MAKDYSDLGLTDKLQKKDSLTATQTSVSFLDFDSEHDTGSINLRSIDRESIFNLGSVTITGTTNIANDVRATIQVIYTDTTHRRIRPMTSLADLYIVQRDDTHVWNSVDLDGDLTADQNKAQFWVSVGQREHEITRNQLGITYQITNSGTGTYDYILDHTITYVPLL